MVDTRLPIDIEKSVIATFDEAETSEPIPPSDIVSYNELRSCADLFRLYESEKLEIQPDFQREIVWKATDQTRFIDSLVKQLPIPSMCFSLDYKTQKWKVIDGLQRMNSIISFLGESVWRLKDLEDIHPELRGKRNIDLANGSDSERRLFTTVQDVSIPITVLRCDYSQPAHMNYLFTIFHRLNSGGVRLNNQEIRNCIYSGRFNSLLKDFDREDKSWAKIKKRIWGSWKRFRSVELLLRALAFSEQLSDYDGNLARFLNRYMHENIDIDENCAQVLRKRFSEMSEIADTALSNLEGSKVSLTFIEAALVGVLRHLPELKDKPAAHLQRQFDEMLSRLEEAEVARYAIASERNVKQRMDIAIEAFSE